MFLIVINLYYLIQPQDFLSESVIDKQILNAQYNIWDTHCIILKSLKGKACSPLVIINKIIALKNIVINKIRQNAVIFCMFMIVMIK